MTLLKLPDDVLDAVHAFLWPAAGAYCPLKDQGRAMRCACSVLRSATARVLSVVETARCRRGMCRSVKSVVHNRFRCSGPAALPNLYIRPRSAFYDPATTCVVHDCCSADWDDATVLAMHWALDNVLQKIATAAPVTQFFLSWQDLSNFTEVLNRAGVSLYGYDSYVTRRRGGIRVSWVAGARSRGRTEAECEKNE